MTRLLLLTKDPSHGQNVGQHLEKAGAVVASLPGPVTTAILPTLGPITINCVVHDDQIDRLSGYRDAMGVAILANMDNGKYHADLQQLAAAAKRDFSNCPIAVGVSVDLTDSLVAWVADALNRTAKDTPVYQVDSANQSDVFTLLATTLCLAHEAETPQ